MKFEELCEEIYENAKDDRDKAQELYEELKNLIDETTEKLNKAQNFAIHGHTVAQYLHLINKANEQLLKLASLIRPAEVSKGGISNEKFWTEIEKQSPSIEEEQNE